MTHFKGVTRKIVAMKGHTESVDQVCWDSVGDWRLATASSDRTVRIWDTRSSPSTVFLLIEGGKNEQLIETLGENINICWSPDGNAIAVGNKEDVVCIIDTRNWMIASQRKYDTEVCDEGVHVSTLKVNEISWDWTGKFFFLTTGQGSVKILEYPSLAPFKTLEAHTANVYCIELDPMGRFSRHIVNVSLDILHVEVRMHWLAYGILKNLCAYALLASWSK